MVYAAAWNGDPFRLFLKAPESAASGLLEFPDANLLAISRLGELAAVVRYTAVPPGKTRGMLVRAPLEGGAPREVEPDVLFADFAPDGRELAVVRSVEGKTVLEFPIGVKIYETDGAVTFPRVSPKGDLVAFLDHPVQADSRGTVVALDRSGRKRVLSTEWPDEVGLAWHPRRNEVWFTATDGAEPRAIRAVGLSGKSRVVVRSPGNLTLQDIAADGRALVTSGKLAAWGSWRTRAGERRPNAISLSSNASLVTGLSRDGSLLLFTQFGEGVDAVLRGLPAASRATCGKARFRSAKDSPRRCRRMERACSSLLPVAPPRLRVIPTGCRRSPGGRAARASSVLHVGGLVPGRPEDRARGRGDRQGDASLPL